MTMRDLAAEMAGPKYAFIERERRWLVDGLSRPEVSELPYILIEDRYIRGTRFRLRQMTDSRANRRSWKLTRKYESADALARPIVTAYLSEAEYALFCELPSHLLRKRRYDIPLGEHPGSLDLFEDGLSGLEMLEIEAPDSTALSTLTPPGWATIEVSADHVYQGAVLAANGFPGGGECRRS